LIHLSLHHLHSFYFIDSFIQALIQTSIHPAVHSFSQLRVFSWDEVHTVLRSFPVSSPVLAVSIAAMTCADVHSTQSKGGKEGSTKRLHTKGALSEGSFPGERRREGRKEGGFCAQLPTVQSLPAEHQAGEEMNFTSYKRCSKEVLRSINISALNSVTPSV